MTTEVDRLAAALADRYRVERELGSGGMATVYLAEDLKHGRKVAVKVMHAELAAVLGGDRFLREIRIAANLNHPHILPLHESGEAEGFLYYVMPYVEGESLRDRLEREGPLPIDEAIRITQQVAGALDAAHGAGVIHRDIKPANILLQKGEVLVADFGIALAVRAAGGPRLTESGLSLGTPQYMSPEQASADRHLDARSDIYSLGSVLYEMLIGEPPFTGPSVQAIIAKLMADRVPDLRSTRDTVPPAVEQTVMKALAKLPADRFATAPEFADALTRASTPGVVFSGAAYTEARDPSWRGRVRRALPWTVAGVMVLAAGTALWGPERAPVAPAGSMRSFPTTLAPADSLERTFAPNVALSPDGNTLVYAAFRHDTSRLYARAMDEFEGRPILGTAGGSMPFFSPDGAWVGFFVMTEQRLKKALLGGGVPQLIADSVNWGGASWGAGDTILYGSVGVGLHRVSAAGGTPQRLPLGLGETEEGAQLWPQMLPGGEAVLYTSGMPWAVNQSIAVLNLLTGERKVLIEPGARGEYLPSGHIVYAWSGNLLAAEFDLERLEVTGPSVTFLEGVSTGFQGPHFDVSASGAAVFAPGSLMTGGPGARPVWVDRAGREEALPWEPGSGDAPRLSPDGSRLALWRVEERFNLWIYEFERGGWRRFTDDTGDDHWPVFTPDGERIIFTSNRHGASAFQLLWKPVDGSAPAERLAVTEFHAQAQSWTPDGRTLVFTHTRDVRTSDIWQLHLDGDREPEPLIATRFHEIHPSLSPDGRWLAYATDEPGRKEVVVRPYPALDRVIPISVNGGVQPSWAPDGKELYYTDPVTETSGASFRRLRMMAVAFDDGRVGRPRLLFEGDYLRDKPFGRQYDISPDGQRFLMIKLGEVPLPAPRQLNVVLDWYDVLKEKTER